ncbi:hypothetical protein SUGI_0529770 [Cryptomeria japonica]|uniref:BTB/POZ domain-containing protein At2g04740 n=1 Tax=Cryptomeria japonica TaxID=3369 RepID=UPI002408DCA2|nr:BTB/POZ domain-containing protein At2g04740 [Cryptomeria japonica]GLJ27024.1 hypothetical protein SUGI_0529770 [Cryptomeria japonica]
MVAEGPSPVIIDEDLNSLYYGAEEEEEAPLPLKKVPTGNVYEASRAGDVERLKYLLAAGVNVNARDAWDSVALYYACLAGHLDAARMLLESGAICSENTFDGDRCHYAALNLKVRRLLKTFEARPPPLEPLQSALREVFLSCKGNRLFQNEYASYGSGDGSSSEHFGNGFAPDITFYVQGRPIEAHRAILVARSPFFKKKFQTDWKYRKEIRFSKQKLSFPALYSLIHFFYSDRLDIAVDDMEDLVRICKVCKCEGLKTAVGNELKHQKYANYKLLRDADDSQKRFILQGSSLPEQERLPAAMHRLLHLSLEKSQREMKTENIGQSTGLIDFSDTFDSSNISKTVKNTSANIEVSSENGDLKEFFGQDVTACGQKMEMGIQFQDKCEISNSNQAEKCCQESEMHCKLDTDEMSLIDHADVCFIVEGKKFRSHQVILASRSDYFKARLSRTTGFLEGKDGLQNGDLMLLEEHDLSAEAFEKILEYMYTDKVVDIDSEQAEEMFDAASRYLLFPLKRAVADALLPHLEHASPAELCDWLMLADMYGVWKIREHCLDAMALNFETFAETREFRKMLLALPPPSGDTALRTTVPSAPGEQGKSNQENILDDLREKWLEVEAAELDKRDESALQFDKRLEMLVLVAENENQSTASQELQWS